MRMLSLLLPLFLGFCAPAFAAPLADVQGNTLSLKATGTINKVKIGVPAALAANYTLTLPVDDGTVGQILSTNGSGVLSWIPAGGGTVTDIRGGADVITNPPGGIIGAGTISIGTLGVVRGGTGLSSAIAAGNFLYSDGSAYSAGTIVAGVNTSVTNVAGVFTINSTGTTTVAAGTGINVVQAGNTYTVHNSGVLTLTAGTDLIQNGTSGAVTLSVGTLGVARGGTGRDTIVSAGNFLVNSGGAYVDGTIAAGSGITISRSGGTFTVASSPSAGSGRVGVDGWRIDGDYSVFSGQTMIDGYVYIPYNASITQVMIYHNTSGSAGTTEVDVKYSSGSGQPFTTIFSTTPKLATTAGQGIRCGLGDSITGCTAPVLSTTSVISGGVLRMDVPNTQSGTPMDLGVIIKYQE